MLKHPEFEQFYIFLEKENSKKDIFPLNNLYHSSVDETKQMKTVGAAEDPTHLWSGCRENQQKRIKIFHSEHQNKKRKVIFTYFKGCFYETLAPIDLRSPFFLTWMKEILRDFLVCAYTESDTFNPTSKQQLPMCTMCPIQLYIQNTVHPHTGKKLPPINEHKRSVEMMVHFSDFHYDVCLIRLISIEHVHWPKTGSKIHLFLKQYKAILDVALYISRWTLD